MKQLVAALLMAGLVGPVLADAPVPIKARATEQARVSHAKDWRMAAVDLATKFKSTAEGKSVAVEVEGDSPFLRALSDFLSAELHGHGVSIKKVDADVVLTLRVQRIDHSARNGYNMLDPLPGTAAAAGTVAVKEVLEHTANFNATVLTIGVLSDVLRAVNKQQDLDEIVLTASAAGAGSFHYAESYYVPGNESHNYRDSGLRATTLKVNASK